MSFLTTLATILGHGRLRRDYLEASAQNVQADADEIKRKLSNVVATNARTKGEAVQQKAVVRRNRSRIEATIQAMRAGD